MTDLDDGNQGPSGCTMWFAAMSFAVALCAIIGFLIHAYVPR